jgi:hypothetical protein
VNCGAFVRGILGSPVLIVLDWLFEKRYDTNLTTVLARPLGNRNPELP